MKKYIIGFLSGIIVMGAVVYAADILTSADNISYDNNKTVADALDDLLGKADATSENILSGKKAYVNGELITGAMPNNGAWTGNDIVDGKIMIPEGYHDGEGYVDAGSIYESASDGFALFLYSAGKLHISNEQFFEYTGTETYNYSLVYIYKAQKDFTASVVGMYHYINGNGQAKITINNTEVFSGSGTAQRYTKVLDIKKDDIVKLYVTTYGWVGFMASNNKIKFIDKFGEFQG